MTPPAITVERLGKMYRLGVAQRRATSFQDLLVSLALAPFRKLRGLGQGGPKREEFWALKDVSFEIQQGEVVGIIGRNGAGKSTLLKILSQIVDPTEGQATLRGRVASLLEVGTGFHPELSGRENIFLNGSILGMKRREIVRRFDEIVAFAEVERFLDTPVKRYSSGMYVRLAFAVAAHLDPEILIIDEVLAVGDAEFQKKCLGKMKAIATGGSGRTVLFVSHNLAAMRTLCSRGILLHAGRVAHCGTMADAAERYLSGGAAAVLLPQIEFSPRADLVLAIKDATVLVDGNPSATMPMGAELAVRLSFHAQVPVRDPRLRIDLRSPTGERILSTNNRFQPSTPHPTGLREGLIQCNLGRVPLMPGRYWLSLSLGNQYHDIHTFDDVLPFDVVERDLWGLGAGHLPRASTMWWPATFTVGTTVTPLAQP